MTSRSKMRLKTAAMTGALALALTACSRTDLPQDSLNPAGRYSTKINNLFWPVFWIAVGVFVLVEGLLVFALIRYRHRRGGPQPVQVHGNRRLEIGWTLAPAVLLAGVAFFTVPVIFSLAAQPAEALQITVTGHQWWWEVQYPGLNVVTANEVHIPVGQTVYVSLKSVDVIHSFWVPRLAGKQDLEPGNTTHLKIQANQAGTYEGQCAEYCGVSHANMRLKVFAQGQSDFQAWLAHEAQPAGVPAPGSLAAQGEQLFNNGQFLKGLRCTACHTTDPKQSGTVGPNLAHFGSRTSFAGATFPNRDGPLARWLENPLAQKPGVDMPYLGLSQDQIKALVAYLESLQ